MFKNCHAQTRKVWDQNDSTTWKIQDILKSEILWCTRGCLLRLVWNRDINICQCFGCIADTELLCRSSWNSATWIPSRVHDIFSNCDDDRWGEMDIKPARFRSLM